MPPAEQPDVQANPLPGVASGSFSLQTSPLGAEVFFGMNLTSPTFANPRFRQAIILAVDRAAIVAAGIPGLTANSAIVPDGVPGALPDACREQCVYDPATSKSLLTQNFPNGAIPTVQIDTDDDPSSMKLASLVGLSLAAVGIPIQMKSLPLAEYQRFVTTGQQQLFLTGWVGMAPSGAAYLDPLFRSGSLDNSTSFSSADIDTRLAEALANPDTTARTKQYVGIEQSILAQSPVCRSGPTRPPSPSPRACSSTRPASTAPSWSTTSGWGRAPPPPPAETVRCSPRGMAATPRSQFGGWGAAALG